jgi:hypothetical protein
VGITSDLRCGENLEKGLGKVEMDECLLQNKKGQNCKVKIPTFAT